MCYLHYLWAHSTIYVRKVLRLRTVLFIRGQCYLYLCVYSGIYIRTKLFVYVQYYLYACSAFCAYSAIYVLIF